MALRIQKSHSYHGAESTSVRLSTRRSRSVPEAEIRLVLIGKTGTGKSSAGNTILGSEMFLPARGMSSGTDKCHWKQVFRRGLNIQITDTPGVCDTHRSREEVETEIAKSVATVTPGPHAILMVLRCDRRFTDEEYQAYQDLKQLFGRDLAEHMILVFNGVDELQKGKLDLDTELRKNSPPKLRQLMAESRGLYIGFNNNADWESRRMQGERLLDLVNKVVRINGGRYFSNDLVMKFEVQVMEEVRNDGKTREDVKEDIVKDRAKCFLARLIRIITFGRMASCSIM